VTQFREVGVSTFPFFDKWQFLFFCRMGRLIKADQDLLDAVPLAVLFRDKYH
jgi:hypothetical protein